MLYAPKCYQLYCLAQIKKHVLTSSCSFSSFAPHHHEKKHSNVMLLHPLTHLHQESEVRIQRIKHMWSIQNSF